MDARGDLVWVSKMVVRRDFCDPTVIGASLVKNFFLLLSFFSLNPSYSFMRTQVSVATDCLQSVILGLVTLCLVLFASYPQ